VRGRWSALNSPADKVPSHGLHAYGQTYAIDFVCVPEGEYAPRLAWSPVTRAPDEFPGFGRPVLAPADGTVVRVRTTARDHRSRMSWPGLLLFFAESAGRELAGPSRLLGNHVTIEIAPGRYAVVAHLQRGSVTVRLGDRVEAGQTIGACGNSGSSTEPHVHFQLMDHVRPLFAAGLPFRFADGVPATGELVGQPVAAALAESRAS
jgi:murein DD-endopeptidase MepM/ murein hydrolase activator NlpD